MIYLNEDGTAHSSYSYIDSHYDCQPYAPPENRLSRYDRGYDAGKTAAVVGGSVLGACLAYYILKKINENHS